MTDAQYKAALWTLWIASLVAIVSAATDYDEARCQRDCAVAFGVFVVAVFLLNRFARLR